MEDDEEEVLAALDYAGFEDVVVREE